MNEIVYYVIVQKSVSLQKLKGGCRKKQIGSITTNRIRSVRNERTSRRKRGKLKRRPWKKIYLSQIREFFLIHCTEVGKLRKRKNNKRGREKKKEKVEYSHVKLVGSFDCFKEFPFLIWIFDCLTQCFPSIPSIEWEKQEKGLIYSFADKLWSWSCTVRKTHRMTHSKDKPERAVDSSTNS